MIFVQQNVLKCYVPQQHFANDCILKKCISKQHVIYLIGLKLYFVDMMNICETKSAHVMSYVIAAINSLFLTSLFSQTDVIKKT